VLTAVSAVVGALAVAGSGSGTIAAARTWHVALGGDDGATGSSSDPLATIEQAVRRAENGDTIRIGPGNFHESVQVYGESLTIIGAGMGRTVLDGARPVMGFTEDTDGRYSAPWSTEFDRAVAPYSHDSRPAGGWPEQFFLDGAQLTQVASRAAVVTGTFFHDLTQARVVIADDPSGRTVEGSELNWGVYLNRADGTSLSDLSVRRYATQQRNMAAVRAYANDLMLTRVEVDDNARIGLSAIGDRISFDEIIATDNGHLGIHSHRSHDLAIHRSVVHRNNREFFDPWHSAGGMKLTEVDRVEIRGNDVRDNDGPGIWTDLDVRNAVIAGNLVTGSYRSGIEIELSNGVIVVDNVVAHNGEQGVWVLESSNVDVWHNHLSDHERAVWVLDGPRADLVDVRVGNNVLAGPSSEGMLASVDDWTSQRSAADMRVSFDGNRYWSSTGDGLLRWANWPSPLAITHDLATVRSGHGQESNGEVSRALTNPYDDASISNAPVPAHVAAARSSDPVAPEPTVPTSTTPPSTTPPSTGQPHRSPAARAPGIGVVVEPESAAAVRRGGASPSRGHRSDAEVSGLVDAGGGIPADDARGVAVGEEGWDAFAAEIERLLDGGA